MLKIFDYEKKFKNYSDFIEYFRSFEIDKLEKSEDIFFVYGIMKDLLLNYELPFEDRELISGIVIKLEARFKELNIFILQEDNLEEALTELRMHLSDEDIAQIILINDYIENMSNSSLDVLYHFCCNSQFDAEDDNSFLTQLFDAVCELRYTRNPNSQNLN